MRTARCGKHTGGMAIGLALAAGLAVADGAWAVEASNVGVLLGSWGGSGRVSYTDGSSESVRCTAYYTGAATNLRMSIQCKSENNPIHIRSQLRVAGSQVSGEWEERTFNASGSVSGRSGAGSMSLAISGGGVTGTMAVSFTRSSHTVSITTQNIAMSRAILSFSRR